MTDCIAIKDRPVNEDIQELASVVLANDLSGRPVGKNDFFANSEFLLQFGRVLNKAAHLLPIPRVQC